MYEYLTENGSLHGGLAKAEKLYARFLFKLQPVANYFRCKVDGKTSNRQNISKLYVYQTLSTYGNGITA